MSSAEPFVLDSPLKILYQDQYLVAVDKPSGMLVHRSFLDKHETVFVMQTLRDQIGQHVFPVHRLDRPTSGVLLFALSSDIARLLGEQQEQKQWRKHYLAVVRGFLAQGGELDYPLKEQLDKIADKYSRDDKAPQQAITRYQPLQQVELPIPVSKYPAARYSLVALQPLSGRKHQLRRHLAHLRYPIVGDTSHGDGKHNALFKKHFNCRRLLLLAKQLQLPHPVTGETLVLNAGLNELEPLFEQFGWPVDERYFQQQFAAHFLEEKWQKLP
ncbi:MULTISPECIES: tRNA pseudouridine(65) synthase TruC [unclassified Arsukibacterium]|uniref:tRNA pseudouridine(65) synthase TruC n=1 Tax=unclassified Arsukibacterium TaxID=2635278 RepID=UPI000C957068|nr:MULTISPECIES: tRNA pseudouridine(65) synthase TruC [unclassified Arsukibacterium]MAA95689.1 tRNA pseudouridine(65) synthase TruC [Rheinheimera sp.]HAW92657.1 tRNA pseudouridine(65) synthase TruC [Candidatus Azambacteria bacterium]|tara:strand:- start:4830 stop:5642 length:813 start_codon:yes stop_codon:yes gene_type:complete